MKLIKDFPMLYGQTSTGAIKQWHIKVVLDDGDVVIVTTHGKKDGKQQTDGVTITSGKNIGRANETTIEQQALLDAESKWTAKKAREQYEETIADAKVGNVVNQLPMLAQKYKERKHKIAWPAYVQPKLNGVRNLSHFTSDGVKFISRKGVEYPGLDHIKKELLLMFKGHTNLIPDGELFSRDLSLQEIVSRVKREKADNARAQEVQLHLYDIAVDGMPFNERIELLQKLYDKAFSGSDAKFISVVPTYEVKNEEEMLRFNRQFISEGYEGTMVRNAAGLYEFNHRSTDLQKVKHFEDAEFKIVAVTEGVGREAGLAIFTCTTKEGSKFNVRPKGTFEMRRRWFDEQDDIIGKELTVRYPEMSADNIPQHPIGIIIRDYE